ADVRRGVRAHRRRAGQRHAAAGAVRLRHRLRIPDAALRDGRGRQRDARRGAVDRHAHPAPGWPRQREVPGMSAVRRCLGRRQGGKRWTAADVLTYVYLAVGVLIMSVPVLWLVLSSFKTQANVLESPPTRLPLAQDTAAVPGYPEP